VDQEDEPLAEPLRLQRVLPVARQLSDGTWLVSVEIWESHLVVRWAKPALPRSTRYIEYADDYAPVEPPLGWNDPSGGWEVSDDVGTAYAPGNAGASGSEGGFRGEDEFDPAPPPTATVLRLHHAAAGEEISVSLLD
jgi:hypothetical protein